MARRGIGRRVEGTHAVAAAVAAGRGQRLWVERPRLRHDEIGEIVAAARAGGAVVDVVDSVAEIVESDRAQGLVLEASPIALHSVEDLVGPDAAVLVLDHLEDPHNVGAAVRSAWAAGLTGIVVPERRSAPLGAAAFKAAAGAFEHVPVAMVSSTADAVARLQAGRVWAVGLAAGAPESLFGLPLLTEAVAVCVGAEGSGLGRLVRERVDVLASVPMAPGVESLNASVTAALAAFEIQRVRGTFNRPM